MNATPLFRVTRVHERKTAVRPQRGALALLLIPVLVLTGCRKASEEAGKAERADTLVPSSSASSGPAPEAAVSPPTFETSEELLATFPKEFRKCLALANVTLVNFRTYVSDSTRQVAYTVCSNGKKRMVIGKRDGAPFDELKGPYFLGEDVLYFARSGKHWFQVFNDTLGDKADRPPSTACRGEHDPFRMYCRLRLLGHGPEQWANFVTDDGQQRVVVHSITRAPGATSTLNTQEGAAFDEIGNAAQDPRGTLIHSARKGKRWIVVSGSKKSEEFDQVGNSGGEGWTAIEHCASPANCFEPGSRDVESGTFAFSEDGARILFPARRGKDWFTANWDGVGPRFDSVGAPHYSPKHKDFVYTSRTGKEHFVVVGPERRGPFTGVEALTITPSGDVTYTEHRGKDQFVIVGTERRGPYARVKHLRVSPAGSISYAYSDGEKWRFVRDRETDAPFDDVSAPLVKSGTIAYFGVTKTQDGKSLDTLVVNGRPLDVEPTRAIALDDQGGVAYVVRDAGKLRVDRQLNGATTQGMPLEFEDIQRLLLGPRGELAYAGRADKTWTAVFGGDGKVRGPAMDEIWPLGFTPASTFVYLGVKGDELWRRTLQE